MVLVQPNQSGPDMATVALQGKPCHTNGDLPAVGSKAPDFLLVNGKLQDKSLADFSAKRKLISIVPSLDTGVCATSTKKFNELLSKEVAALLVSADLPFAQGRFCGVEKIKNLTALSMMRSRQFAEDYGVLLVDGPLAGVTARAVLVLDTDDTVLYAELVSDITQEPDYDAAMAALNN